jgi:ACS family tartrate transporter-like MFS transporter
VADTQGLSFQVQCEPGRATEGRALSATREGRTIDQAAEDRIGRGALAKASWRLLPLIGLGYGIAYMDRVNIGFAALRMNHDLGFSGAVYGLGGGLFFLSYALMELPSNLALMRFGARRWIARIMLTWGLIAAAMMLVRTPVEFYALRFALGAAEAGFFPGVVFYLMNWFPAHQRGRAISRFYIALPLSSVAMGLVAGALMGLGGRLGLAGWQWLFLIEGLPALALSVVILFLLPDSPMTAPWLSADEKAWFAKTLAADRLAPGVSRDHGVLGALTDPRIWLLGLTNIFMMAAAYAFTFSAPAMLQGATHLSITWVGMAVAAGGVLGAAAMLIGGAHSDRRRERHLHAAAFMLITGAACGVMSVSASPAVFVAAYLVFAVFSVAIQGVFWLIPSDMLQGRSAAAGVAAIGSIGMVGAFGGPWAWGVVKDATGGYQAGLLALVGLYVVGAALVLLVRRNARAATAAALAAA